jgi:hypothetical protein
MAARPIATLSSRMCCLRLAWLDDGQAFSQMRSRRATTMGGPGASGDLALNNLMQACLAVSDDHEARVNGAYFYLQKRCEAAAAAPRPDAAGWSSRLLPRRLRRSVSVKCQRMRPSLWARPTLFPARGRDTGGPRKLRMLQRRANRTNGCVWSSRCFSARRQGRSCETEALPRGRAKN